MNKLTPMMQQYLEIKSRHPDALLLYRMGDFYELFMEDAVLAARVLEIALTSRDRNAENPVPMCGVPYHSAEGYVSKLVADGHKVAICDQVEDPRMAPAASMARPMSWTPKPSREWTWKCSMSRSLARPPSKSSGLREVRVTFRLRLSGFTQENSAPSSKSNSLGATRRSSSSSISSELSSTTLNSAVETSR